MKFSQTQVLTLCLVNILMVKLKSMESFVDYSMYKCLSNMKFRLSINIVTIFQHS